MPFDPKEIEDYISETAPQVVQPRRRGPERNTPPDHLPVARRPAGMRDRHHTLTPLEELAFFQKGLAALQEELREVAIVLFKWTGYADPQMLLEILGERVTTLPPVLQVLLNRYVRLAGWEHGRLERFRRREAGEGEPESPIIVRPGLVDKAMLVLSRRDPASVATGLMHEVRHGRTVFRFIPTLASREPFIQLDPSEGSIYKGGVAQDRDELIRLVWSRRGTHSIYVGTAADRTRGERLECLNSKCGDVHRSADHYRDILPSQVKPATCQHEGCQAVTPQPSDELGRVHVIGCPRCRCTVSRPVAREERLRLLSSPARGARHQLTKQWLAVHFNLRLQPELDRILLRRPQ